jgi:hypothetical protein
MASHTHSVRIDLSRDLPPRATPLNAEDVAQIFGGCFGEWVACKRDVDCCSHKCRKVWFINGQWTWECLPTWATAP